MDALRLLDEFVDDSDPDVSLPVCVCDYWYSQIDVPNLIHAYQTAERIRHSHPDKPWLQLTGLIHDFGKIMSVWGEVQFATTGDTYPVGCLPAESIVYRATSFDGNPDLDDPRYK